MNARLVLADRDGLNGVLDVVAEVMADLAGQGWEREAARLNVAYDLVLNVWATLHAVDQAVADPDRAHVRHARRALPSEPVGVAS